ncbi:MAG: SAM-dependent methyltransferase [Simkaniaceae bacterium]|nr:SAM-dependent methyltransferase [Simkaniaceae bacterium]
MSNSSGSKPGLILLPNLLSHEAVFKGAFVEFLRPEILKLQGLFIESMKGGKAFMSLFKEPSLNKATLSYLNEHTKPDELDFLLEPIEQGETWGIVSDAGMPVIADPGSNLILRAHQKGIPVSSYGMTSSILGALQLSGLPGQHFTFEGYLPREEKQRKEMIQKIEAASKKDKSTHLFIETPYRNRDLFQALLQTLHPKTYLSISIELSSPREVVYTKRVEKWKGSSPFGQILDRKTIDQKECQTDEADSTQTCEKHGQEKRPAIFVINAAI